MESIHNSRVLIVIAAGQVSSYI